MGFFYKAGGGGGNDPTYPASPLTVASDATGTSFTLTNSGTTPASVELSFSSDTGSASLLKGSDFDQGTERSPTYVVDPDTGTRTVNLVRGSLSPSDPSSTETVTLTSNAGVLPQTITCTVYPIATFDAAVGEIATPTLESTFADTSNSGSLGGSFTTSNFTITADSSDYSGFAGYGVPGSAGTLTRSSIAQTVWGRTTGTIRTWIFVWTQTGTMGTPDNRFIVASKSSSSRSAAGQMKATNPIRADDSVRGAIAFNTTHSHCASDGTTITTSASENMVNTTNDLTVLACTFNGLASPSGSVRYRWKQAGHGSGFSFGDKQRDPNSNFTTDFNLVGGYMTGNIKFRYAAIIDSDITHSQFLDLLNTAGL